MIAGLSSEVAVELVEGNLWSMWSAFGRGDECQLIDEPELLRFETPLAYAPYNSVMRFRYTERVDDAIDAVLEPYARRNVPVMWVVHPSAQPLDLADRLVARGLVESEVVPGMVARLDDAPALDPLQPGVVIEPVTRETGHEFLQLTTWRYALPDSATPTLQSILDVARFGAQGSATHGWVARFGGEVVSKVVLHVDNGVGGIYGVATKPEARGLGLARQLTISALDAARAMGVKVAVLHSTPMAKSLYEGLGFRTVADLVLYSTPDSLHL
jgi:ribosomal protein S18 acetylase RimI-like enzyme